jgi:hypothetical protein
LADDLVASSVDLHQHAADVRKQLETQWAACSLNDSETADRMAVELTRAENERIPVQLELLGVKGEEELAVERDDVLVQMVEVDCRMRSFAASAVEAALAHTHEARSNSSAAIPQDDMVLELEATARLLHSPWYADGDSSAPLRQILVSETDPLVMRWERDCSFGVSAMIPPQKWPRPADSAHSVLKRVAVDA